MRKTKPIWPTRRGIAEEECAKRSQTWSNWVMWAKAVAVWGVARPRSEMCKTNPISPSRRRVTEGIVQNEAKLGVTGVCGQRQVWRGARLGRGVECAERTQFPPAGGNWPRKLCETNPIWGRRGRVPEAKCAKRTQFRPAREEVGRGRPTHEEAKRAKRSQFARSTRHRMPAASLAARDVYCLLTIPAAAGTGHLTNSRRRPNLLKWQSRIKEW
jgi:hypothetical protein